MDADIFENDVTFRARATSAVFGAVVLLFCLLLQY